MVASTSNGHAALIGSVQVAEWLGMSREQVWRLWASGKLPGYRFDRNLRFDPRDVQAFLDRHYSGNRAVATPP